LNFFSGNCGVNVLLVTDAESFDLVTSSWPEGCGKLGSVKILPVFSSFIGQDTALLNFLSSS
jgi:hypothetical protein